METHVFDPAADTTRTPSTCEHMIAEALAMMKVAPCGKPYGLNGACSTYAQLVDIIDRFRDSSSPIELAQHATVTACVFTDFLTATYPFSLHNMSSVTNQTFADIAYFSLHCSIPDLRDKAVAYLSLLRTEVFMPCCLSAAIKRAGSHSPSGRTYGRDGYAYRNHETAQAIGEWLASGRDELVFDHASVRAVAFTEVQGAVMATWLEKNPDWITENDPHLLANIIYFHGHVADGNIRIKLGFRLFEYAKAQAAAKQLKLKK